MLHKANGNKVDYGCDPRNCDNVIIMLMGTVVAVILIPIEAQIENMGKCHYIKQKNNILETAG